MKTEYPNGYVLTVMADDHPGIIAAVSDAITSLGGNIDTCSQTVLSGYFTLIMVVSLPQPIDPRELARRVSGDKGGGTFQVLARQFIPAQQRGGRPEACETFVITAFGKDRPGIVKTLSQYLSGKDINIADFYWQRNDGDFVMVSQIEIPNGRQISMLQADLEQIGLEQGFNVRLQHENIFVATNQLRMTNREARVANE